MSHNKIVFLNQSQMPTHYYNVLADIPVQMDTPLHPATKQPIGPQELSAIFPMELIKQEVTQERFVEIPDEVRDLYKLSRPTPLIRASNLEKALDTPAKIFFKYEGANPTGSHKTNTSYPQAYYNKQAGIKKLVTETGAGQWGSALAMACKHFGMAISEAIETAVQRDDTNYSLGSVLNHVLLHQTIIGEEARIQLEGSDEYPDVIIGCVGGGSNFAGIAFPFLRDKLSGLKNNLEVIAVEPASCPSLTQGKYDYDFGDEAGMTPLLKMYTLGHDFIPPKIHAGGLRYHGVAPSISLLYNLGVITANAYDQIEVFEAAQLFAQTEGIVPAPESSHAIKEVIEQALRCKETGERKTILFNLSGHGFLDLGSYEMFLENQLENYSSETNYAKVAAG